MFLDIGCRELVLTELTLTFLMEFLFVLFLEIDVIVFSTCGTFLNIPATVTEVSGNLGLGEHLLAVLAFFHGLTH